MTQNDMLCKAVPLQSLAEIRYCPETGQRRVVPVSISSNCIYLSRAHHDTDEIFWKSPYPEAGIESSSPKDKSSAFDF